MVFKKHHEEIMMLPSQFPPPPPLPSPPNCCQKLLFLAAEVPSTESMWIIHTKYYVTSGDEITKKKEGTPT